MRKDLDSNSDRESHGAPNAAPSSKGTDPKDVEEVRDIFAEWQDEMDWSQAEAEQLAKWESGPKFGSEGSVSTDQPTVRREVLKPSALDNKVIQPAARIEEPNSKINEWAVKKLNRIINAGGKEAVDREIERLQGLMKLPDMQKEFPGIKYHEFDAVLDKIKAEWAYQQKTDAEWADEMESSQAEDEALRRWESRDD